MIVPARNGAMNIKYLTQLPKTNVSGTFSVAAGISALKVIVFWQRTNKQPFGWMSIIKKWNFSIGLAVEPLKPRSIC